MSFRLAVGLMSVLLIALLAQGCAPPSLLITPVQSPVTLQEMEVQPASGWTSSRIAIIEVEGVILNARTPGLISSGENPLSLFKQQLTQAARDDRVKAVVLRINSPGGAVTASDTMYELVNRFRKMTGKPVIASMQDVATSGAYYVACGADVIYANPTSVVGNIGVIFMTFDASGTLNLIGLKTQAIKSGANKDMGSPLRPLDDSAKQIMQAMVDEYFQRFLSVVQEGRKLSPEQLKAVSDGRVFSGQQALQLKLVDHVGLLEDAVKEAKKRGGDPSAAVIIYRRPYGYGGSIYAENTLPRPEAAALKLPLVGSEMMPTGFYYLWRP